jgi:predicted ABC-class ATPase
VTERRTGGGTGVLAPIPGLRERLERLDGRGYRAYKDITGGYAADGFTLLIDHVQGDPFAEPSRLRVLVPRDTAVLPAFAHASAASAVATADFLNRRLAEALARFSRSRGSGQSGELRVLRPGQQVLRRSSLHVAADGGVEARFQAGLPARGRTALGREAAEMLTSDVPAAVMASLVAGALDLDALERHVNTVLDAQALRAQLEPHGLVAFVADGARLPRRSGVEDTPLQDSTVTSFTAPDSLRIELRLTDGSAVTGMGVPAGVTLIVGGGFHGKSTLLRALERGVYDHVPGDGRERVVTRADAVKVRAEDGRSVAGTDIGNFIGTLPGGRRTDRFETANASGSTSQAASIIEALEAGARCLLLDEDTSATNFMIRDARMQALIASEHEPITPFIDRARALADGVGVSTVIVVGGAGDYFDVADTVIALQEYVPAEVTAEARAVAAAHPTARRPEGGEWRPVGARVPLPDSLDPSLRHHAVHVRARTEQRALFGAEEVELSAVEQLVETAQARAIALAIAAGRGTALDGRRTVRESLVAIMERLEAAGLDAFQQVPAGELAAFRIFELAAFLNRIRTLRTEPPADG